MAASTPMFLADAGLGRLATWLRLLGFDAAYERGDLAAALRRARAEDRVLLTRHRAVRGRRRVPPYFFVEADDFRAQLQAVLRHFGLDPSARFLGRCARCNTPLTRLDPAEARRRVPAYVGATQTIFHRCPSCDRVYWPATHVERMRRELAALPGEVPPPVAPAPPAAGQGSSR